MDQPNLDNFKTINTIIARDSKDATYKFALLRGAIEISQEYSHLKQESESGNRVVFPLGLLVEKWLLYYYPLIASGEFIPQKNGEHESSQNKLKFRKSFERVTHYYDSHGGFSAFYNDFVNGTIPADVSPALRELITDLKITITKMPMKHLGWSVYQQYYSVFRDEGGGRRLPANIPVSQELLLQNLGYFSFPKDLFAVFEYLGSFISGEDSLLYQWAEFTSAASKGALSAEFVLEKLKTFPQTERDVRDARTVYDRMFREHGAIECVWSGKQIKDQRSLHIDHLIPFTVWKNNDLWNLLPTTDRINANKRDRIPAPAFIEQRSDSIQEYWDIMQVNYPKKFDREMNISLTGPQTSGSDWHDVALDHLMEKCDYLINIRGYDAWDL